MKIYRSNDHNIKKEDSSSDEIFEVLLLEGETVSEKFSSILTSLDSHETRPCPLSHKKSPENAENKSRVKESSFSEEDSSTRDRSTVLKTTSASKVAIENNSEQSNIREKRRFSADSLLNTSTLKNKDARTQRSYSIGENDSPKNNDITYSEKENLKKEFHELITKIKNLNAKEKSTFVEKPSDKNSSDQSSIYQCELSKNSLARVALPVKIKLGAIKGLNEISRLNNSQRISNSKNERIKETDPNSDFSNSATESSDLNPSETQKSTPSKEKRKRIQNQENEISRRKISRLEEVESAKKKKKKPVKKTKNLKSVFRELFGDENEDDIQKNLSSGINHNTLAKRRKVVSRDSCDSGAYCSEASPGSIITFSKDVDPSEMISPDSTEIECKKLKDLEILESLPEFSEPRIITADKLDKVPQTVDNFRITNERERNLDNFIQETNDERSVLPDSSTCISEDELTIECSSKSPRKKIPDLPLQHLNEPGSENPSKTNLNGPSDDTLSKAGIVRDLDKDSYVFSSDDIHLLLNLLSETPTNPKQNPTESDSGKEPCDKSLENTLENEEPLEPEGLVIDLDYRDDSDVEIVMEKGPTTPVPDTEKSLPTESNQVEERIEPEPVIEPQISFPRLRVKHPSELGCPTYPTRDSGLVNSQLNVPFYQSSSNLQMTPPMWTQHPTPDFSTPSTSTSTLQSVLSHQPNPNIQRVNRLDQFTSGPNHIVNTALAAAQRLISLINPLTIPEAPQLSHYYNMLISLLEDIGNDTRMIRNSYQNRPYGLFSRDLLNYNLSLNRKLRSLAKFLNVAFEENTMRFILQNYHALTTQTILNNEELHYIMSLQYSDNPPAPLDQRSLPVRTPSVQIRLSPPLTSQPVNDPRIRTFSPQAPLISLPPSEFQPARKANSRPPKNNRRRGLLTNDQYIVLKTQIKAYIGLIMSFNKLKESQSSEVSTVSTVPTVSTEASSTVIFRRKKTQVGERIENKSGLSITPIEITSSISKPLPSKSVPCRDVIPFPSDLTITAILTTASTIPTTSIPKSTLTQSKCTITPISTSPIVSSAPSVIVSPIVPSPTVPSPIVSLAFNQSQPSPVPLVTSNQTEVPTSNQNKIYTINSSIPPSSGSAISSSAIVSLPIVTLTFLNSPITSAPIVFPAPISSVPPPSNQIQVIITNPKAINRNLPLSPNKMTSIKTSSPKTRASTATTPISNLAKLADLSNSTKIPAFPTKEISNSSTFPAAPAKVSNFVSVEKEFRSMPSLSPGLSSVDKTSSVEKTSNVDKNSTVGEAQNPVKNKKSENTQERVVGQIQEEEDDLLCFRCKKKSTVVCARCQKAIYCSKLCQEKHWETTHHETCQDSSGETKISPGTKDN